MALLSKYQNHNSPSPECTSDLPPQTCLFSKLNHDLRATMLRIEITTIIHPLPASPMLPICKTTTIFHPRSSSQCWSNSQKAITQLVLLGLASNIPFEATVTLETIYFLTLKVKSNISFCQKQDVGIEQELFDKLLFFSYILYTCSAGVWGSSEWHLPQLYSKEHLRMFFDYFFWYSGIVYEFFLICLFIFKGIFLTYIF